MTTKQLESWKKQNKPPACTSNPIEHLIPVENRQEILNKIKQESIDEYSYDVLAQCKKRKVCLQKTCMGRELPWKSPTAKPYLDELAKTQKIENGFLIIKTSCTDCPIRTKCSSTCDQINDFIKRDKTKSPRIISDIYSSNKKSTIHDQKNHNTFSADTPWDILSNRRRKVIQLRQFQNKEYKYIAYKLGLNNQARAKYEYFAALTQISEYSIVREFLRENVEKLTEKQKLVLMEMYYNNKTATETAKIIGTTKQAVQQMQKRVFAKFNVSWKIFVKKRGNKVEYDIPEGLK